MNSLFLVYALVVGFAVGSFLNVVIFRYHTGRGITGRSFCASCGRKLSWVDLVPVFSFLFLRGKCRTCRARLSWQYPLVELFTGLVFFLALKQFLESNLGFEPLLLLLVELLSWPLLVVMLVYDFRHKIIPDSFVFSFAAITFVYRFALAYMHGFSYESSLNLGAGAVLFVPFFLLWFLSRGRWMGLGDGKLSLGIGWLLGMSGGISAVILGFWLGAVVGVALMLVTRLQSGRSTLTMKSEIPFGPFLIAGIFAVSFCGFSLFNLFLF